jgi:hypothetical protein
MARRREIYVRVEHVPPDSPLVSRIKWIVFLSLVFAVSILGCIGFFVLMALPGG